MFCGLVFSPIYVVGALSWNCPGVVGIFRNPCNSQTTVYLRLSLCPSDEISLKRESKAAVVLARMECVHYGFRVGY